MNSRLKRGLGFTALAGFLGTLCLSVPAHAAASPVAKAYVVSADAIGGLVSVAPVPVSQYPPGGTVTQVGIHVGPFASNSLLTAATAGSTSTGTSSAVATVDSLNADFGALGSIALTGVESECHATPGGASGNGFINNGTVTVAGNTVSLQAGAGPNTVVNVAGLGQITLNEQTVNNGVLTINSVHLTLLPQLGGANVIVGHAECAGAAVPPPPPVSPPSITETAAEKSFVSGETIHYAYTVTNNSGSTSLTNIAVTDHGPGTPQVSCPQNSLPPGASEVCTATYTATDADAKAGKITDTATVTGTLGSTQVSATSDPLTIPLRGLAITGSAEPNSFQQAGQTITYTYTVTNTGQAPLTNLTVHDSLTGTDAGCDTNQLAPGQSTTCKVTYTTTQADVERGSITDQATATATDSGGQTITVTSASVTTPVSGLAITGSAEPNSFQQAGQTITYTYTVTNRGQGPLTNLTVHDSLTGTDATCDTDELAPGQSTTCKVTYTTTQADVERGSITDQATATATDSAGQTITVTSAPVTTSLNRHDDCRDNEKDHHHHDNCRGDKDKDHHHDCRDKDHRNGGDCHDHGKKR
ncbi:choice-of-anchor P family protein [Streptomyces cynarae]|uniref:choice-of-anchor P family protein n=1 Tax=Streptomyces cynarae TaxID=2981134 RepID=UPI00406C06C3